MSVMDDEDEGSDEDLASPWTVVRKPYSAETEEDTLQAGTKDVTKTAAEEDTLDAHIRTRRTLSPL